MGLDCIDLAWGRERWRAVVDSVTNPPGFVKGGRDICSREELCFMKLQMTCRCEWKELLFSPFILKTGSMFIDNFVAVCLPSVLHYRNVCEKQRFGCSFSVLRRRIRKDLYCRSLLPVGSAMSCAFTQWLTSTLRTGLFRSPVCLCDIWYVP